jgi:hypothetical protein
LGVAVSFNLPGCGYYWQIDCCGSFKMTSTSSDPPSAYSTFPFDEQSNKSSLALFTNVVHVEGLIAFVLVIAVIKGHTS